MVRFLTRDFQAFFMPFKNIFYCLCLGQTFFQFLLLSSSFQLFSSASSSSFIGQESSFFKNFQALYMPFSSLFHSTFKRFIFLRNEEDFFKTFPSISFAKKFYDLFMSFSRVCHWPETFTFFKSTSLFVFWLSLLEALFQVFVMSLALVWNNAFSRPIYANFQLLFIDLNHIFFKSFSSSWPEYLCQLHVMPSLIPFYFQAIFKSFMLFQAPHCSEV